MSNTRFVDGLVAIPNIKLEFQSRTKTISTKITEEEHNYLTEISERFNIPKQKLIYDALRESGLIFDVRKIDIEDVLKK